MVCWGNAWLAGQVGLDEAADRVERQAGPQLVAGEAGDVPLRGFLADLRVEGMRSLRLALPVAGDPLGLTGPPSFNSAAIEAGQAVTVVFPGRCLGMVPVRDRRGSSYAGVRWSVLEASVNIPDIPSLAEAEHALTLAMREATDALLGVEGPAQGHRRTQPLDDGLAPGYPARAHRVAALAARLSAALQIADERGLTSGQVAVRSQALRALDRAVRRARVAAHHAITELV
ncbi:hypothetical protein GCM10017600_11360 [Streptosporangium carneum]|uniref:Uncharacterized protein n=1 Tax=Streptosporangium carneum TaxID=47481 RepID=A0A9W6HXT1_9ACTN|nr:hypothetical protein GCM10017600_11360 [Streptosporangium carneum]